MDTIAVIGAGQMGSGIAHVAALAGYRVLLHDQSEALISAALDVIKSNLARQQRRGQLEEAAIQKALARIEPARGLAESAKAGLVIESISENEQAKRALLAELAELGPVLPPETLLASNTSSLSITRLAGASGRADKFMGMHFMNPVPMMELVELVRGIATSDETYAAVKAVAIKMGKIPVLVEDSPAFIVNRLLMPMINEAIYALHEGAGAIADIDQALRLGAHHRMGPLQLADFIGLDTCLAIMQVLHEGLADSKYRPCPLLVKYVDAGWLGRKTGRGFYDYAHEPPKPTR